MSNWKIKLSFLPIWILAEGFLGMFLSHHEWKWTTVHFFVSKGEMIDNVNPCTIVLVSITIAPDETPWLKAMGECLPL